MLSVIYMNRFLKHWRLTGRGEAFRAHVVSYADDFVILSRGHAEEALTWTKAVMTKLGLTLNEAKTSVKDARRRLRLPWPYVGTAPPAQWWPLVSWGKPVQEERAAGAALGRALIENGYRVRLFTFTRLPFSQWRSARTTNAIERLHEEFKRRIKTQTVLPSAEIAAMLFWALLASDVMRKMDGWPKPHQAKRQNH